MIFNNLYRDYLLHQAVNHPDLQHQPEKDKVFEMMSIEEAVGDFRTTIKEKGFIMRGIHYTYSISDKNADAMKQLTCGFVIAKYHSSRTGGKEAFQQVLVDTEKVVDEIVEKMIADSKNGHPLFYYSLNTAQNVSVIPKVSAGEVGYSGWLCTFRIANHWRNCIKHTDAPQWADDGKTPY